MLDFLKARRYKQTSSLSLSLSLSLAYIQFSNSIFDAIYIYEYSPLKRALRCGVVSNDDDRTFREFLWLSKRCSATPADHAAATEDAKRTLRHILLLPVDDDTKTQEGSKDTTLEGFNKDSSSSVRTQKARQFLLSKIGALKMRASSGVLRDLRSSRAKRRKKTRNNDDSDDEDENDDDNDGSVSTTFVLRDGALVAKDDVDDVATKGRRVADGRLSNEEAWTYHTRLMKRQYYGKTPPRSSEPF